MPKDAFGQAIFNSQPEDFEPGDPVRVTYQFQPDIYGMFAGIYMRGHKWVIIAAPLRPDDPSDDHWYEFEAAVEYVERLLPDSGDEKPPAQAAR